MKIAIICSRLSGGGAERAAAELSKYFSRKGLNVVVIVYHGEVSYEYEGKLIDLDLAHRPKNKLIEKAGRLVRRTRLLRKVLKSEKPDVILSFMDTFSIFALLNKVTGVPGIFITSTQIPPSMQYSGYRKLIYGMLITSLFKRANQVLALSNGIKYDLNHNFSIPEKKIRVIHNPVDIERTAAVKKEVVEHPAFKTGNPVLVTVGRMVPQKNHPLLLKAFKRVLETQNAELVLVGTGRLEVQTKALVNELGIQDNVHFLGWQDNPFKFCHQADLFVLSSDFEGFGNVIIEAMAADCPVLSTDCPWGPGEILEDDKYGMLTPVNDEEKLAAKIVLLLQDKKLLAHYKNKAMERCHDFSLEVIGDQYLDLIRSLPGADLEIPKSTQKV